MIIFIDTKIRTRIVGKSTCLTYIDWLKYNHNLFSELERQRTPYHTPPAAVVCFEGGGGNFVSELFGSLSVILFTIPIFSCRPKKSRLASHPPTSTAGGGAHVHQCE